MKKNQFVTLMLLAAMFSVPAISFAEETVAKAADTVVADAKDAGAEVAAVVDEKKKDAEAVVAEEDKKADEVAAPVAAAAKL